MDASRFRLQEIMQYFHSAYVLFLQQLYRILSGIVGNELAACAECTCMESGVGRGAHGKCSRWPVRCLAAAVDESGERTASMVHGVQVKRWSMAGVICLLVYSFGCLLYSFGMCEWLAYSFGCQNVWLTPLVMTDVDWLMMLVGVTALPFISSQRRTDVLWLAAWCMWVPSSAGQLSSWGKGRVVCSPPGAFAGSWERQVYCAV